MQGHQDSAAAEALESFTTALATAQAQLQQEEARRQHAESILSRLTAENERVKRGLLHNPQQLAKLETLRQEKAKMEHVLADQRERFAQERDYVLQVRRQRQETEDKIEQRSEELRRLKMEYAKRSAAVHRRVAQSAFVAHHQLQGQRTWLERKEQEVSRRRSMLTEAERQRQVALEELHFFTAAQTTGKVESSGEEAAAAAVAAASADGTGAARENEESAVVKVQEGADMCHSTVHTTGSDGALPVESMEQLEERLKATAQRHAAMRVASEEQLSQLCQQRESLKASLKALCEEVEAADARQQAQQRAWVDALNAVSLDGRCGQCGGDLAAGLY